MRKSILTAAFLTAALVCGAQQNRWNISEEYKSIEWNVSGRLPHDDHIEMSGEQISAVLRYGVRADGSFTMERSVIWPMLRTIPNNTHASLMRRFAIDYPSLVQVNGRTLQEETVRSMTLDGRLTVVSEYSLGKYINGSLDTKKPAKAVEVTRVIFPSTTLPMLCERYVIKNIGERNIKVNVPEERSVYHTDPAAGTEGSYTLVSAVKNAGMVTLAPGEEYTFFASVQGWKNGQSEIDPDVPAEEQKRMAFVGEVQSRLEFESPDDIINTMYSFAKIRAGESIYRTKGGLMHGPGGESYYAAIWANDQAEYVSPFFAFLGYRTGMESGLNAYLHFARFMNEEYKPIPSSIIAEGDDIWDGAGDRGDAAMIAYGAARYVLARADRTEADKLWPLIKWCLEYCRRHINENGVVASDSDELEGRFPAGDANLNTSCLYYDALISASYLARELGEPSSGYRKQAQSLKKAINSYFSAEVEGFETYRYYEGNDLLRSWICTPLAMGIMERKDGTVKALLSPGMWTEHGLLTQSGSVTFWDRSALYALRGVYAAGEREKATSKLHSFSSDRLLGEHVPYAVEAWPEGSQRHLSAESGLYCRIITEGLFGIRPAGFSSFLLTPQIPEEWPFMKLKNIDAFAGEPFSIVITREGMGLKISLEREGKAFGTYRCKVGETISCTL